MKTLDMMKCLWHENCLDLRFDLMHILSITMLGKYNKNNSKSIVKKRKLMGMRVIVTCYLTWVFGSEKRSYLLSRELLFFA